MLKKYSVRCLVVTLLSFAPTRVVDSFGIIPALKSSPLSSSLFASSVAKADDKKVGLVNFADVPNEITEKNPLHVIIAGAGVGGLALANSLVKNPKMKVTLLEKTDQFKRFGGPIQLASNALEVIKTMDSTIYDEIMKVFTYTGDKENGIKDGIRDEWYAKFDLASPAESRNMAYGGVIERPDLQQIYLDALPDGVVKNGAGVVGYVRNKNGAGVEVQMDSGESVQGDVLIGADGIWSSVRASMRDEPKRGEGSGVSYSGYTVFAGELDYASHDNGQVGYKVYIGPNQYFVITDIGNDRYQWYAFLAKPAGSAALEEYPDGKVPYLGETFTGWSKDIHHILDATKENEVDQRDLYDRPPSVRKTWTDGSVALLGDAVHAMMPNLGQGGCQAIEDAFVIVNELEKCKTRNQLSGAMSKYRGRRLIRSAAVQGLSRFASDIIIRGFDTPAKIEKNENGSIKFGNFNYAGVVTRLLQPILPIFFTVQFNFLFDGWKNEFAVDTKATIGFIVFGGIILLLSAGSLEIGLVIGPLIEGLFGAEGLLLGGGEGVLGTEGVQNVIDAISSGIF